MDPGEDPDREKELSPLVTVARFSGHGLTLALAMGLFLLVGWVVDGRIGTTPLFTVVGALVGAAAGFYHMLHHLIFLPREEARRREEEGDGKPSDGGRDGA